MFNGSPQCDHVSPLAKKANGSIVWGANTVGQYNKDQQDINGCFPKKTCNPQPKFVKSNNDPSWSNVESNYVNLPEHWREHLR